VNGHLLVARGSGGLVSFDPETKKTIWENRLGQKEDGWPVAVTGDDKKGFAAIQSSHENGFTGIMTFDLKTGAVLQRSPYNYAYGVIGIDVRASMLSGSIILNNQGWIHILTASQVASGRSMRPRWIAHQVPRNGDVNPHYMMLEGDFIIEGTELVGCGKYNALSDEGMILKGKPFRVKLK
jgi:outer membrane protein assembly factor BamB